MASKEPGGSVKPTRMKAPGAPMPAMASGAGDDGAMTVSESVPAKPPRSLTPQAATPVADMVPPMLAAPLRADMPVAVVTAPEPVATVPVAAPSAPLPPQSATETSAAPAVVAAPAPAPDSATPAPMSEPAPLPAKEKTMDAMNTTADTTHAAADHGQALFADWNDRTKTAMEKSTKMFEEMNEFAKANVEAVVESSRVAAKGVEALSQEAAEYTRKSFEQATAMMKSMAAVKSPAELMKMQSEFMRQSFDAAVAETSRSTEAMMKLAGDVAQPLSSRVAVAAEKARTLG